MTAVTPNTTTAACPKGLPHTVMPSGYVEWHAYADQLSATHRQKRCLCGEWAIWVPKEKP